MVTAELPTSGLLERDNELAALGEALAQARIEHGRLVLIEAPAGFGKTSLLRIAAEGAAANGFITLRARASELERDFAYGVVRQLLEPAIGRLGSGDRDRVFAGAANLARPLFNATAETMTPPTDDRSFAVLHGLYWLVNNFADDAPVLASVDDLQWADQASLRFLNYLMPRLDGLRLALVAATRPEEGVIAEIARLAAGPDTTLLGPGALSLAAVAEMCEHRLGAEVATEFAAACRGATGGNPFLLEALLRDAAESGLATAADGAERVRAIGPSAVARAVLLRLSGRPPAATALVRSVAVLGDRTSALDASLMAGLSDTEGQRAADTLVALGLLQVADGLEFVHPIVREAVYGDMSHLERSEAHARAATLLTERGASEERIAAQLSKASPLGDPARVELLRRVALGALARGAPGAAAAWLERALAEPPPAARRGELLLALSLARLRLGAPEAAIEPLTIVVDETDDDSRRAQASRMLGMALTWTRRADAAVAALTAAIEAIEPRDREQALLLEADRAAAAQQASLEARLPVRAALERRANLRGATRGERLVLAELAFERARSSTTEREAVAHLEGALAGGQLVEEHAHDGAATLYVLLVGLLSTDALDVVDDCLARMLAPARTRASIPAQAFVIVFRGWASLRRGDVTQAEEDARLALDLVTTSNVRLGQLPALALLTECLIERGDIEAAADALRGFGDEPPSGFEAAQFVETTSHLRLAQGRTREAFEGLVAFGRYNELWGGANPLASRWRSTAALALAAFGDGAAARELAADDLDRARRWGAASGMGIARRAAALVDLGPNLVDRLQDAATMLESSPAKLELARALIDLGAALRRANRRSEARRSLEKGLQIARRCGATRLIETARTELRAAGGRSSDRRGSGIDELTTSELRVAELAAAGQSNPEIAQALFVTRKTVETHLGHVYQKLEISGRGKLARALAAREPPHA